MPPLMLTVEERFVDWSGDADIQQHPPPWSKKKKGATNPYIIIARSTRCKARGTGGHCLARRLSVGRGQSQSTVTSSITTSIRLTRTRTTTTTSSMTMSIRLDHHDFFEQDIEPFDMASLDRRDLDGWKVDPYDVDEHDLDPYVDEQDEDPFHDG
ncbi:hypothetical protein BU23DRAFT_151240 [Bimuria novae-zelandiae CBS 107.79]|uniref:Uncharacterized protein n=1 Tax=Bimuria novae-zelandiae CBS 107.79 TaxID=1447943 RepID=A0A6A5VPJ0_9PLEO|nr:hypothetical protein BU23DRAFT_151240 [Bimuria novae-zelandiae CBS 107.79]